MFKKIKDHKHFLSDVLRLFKLLWSISPRFTMLSLIVSMMQAILPIAMLYVGKEIIDATIEISTSDKKVENFFDLEYLIFWIVIGFVLFMVRNLLGKYYDMINSLLRLEFKHECAKILMKKAQELELKYVEDPEFYNKFELAAKQDNARLNLINIVLAQLKDMVTIAGLLAVLLIFNPFLVLILSIAVIPIFLTESFFNEKIYKIGKRWAPLRRELNYIQRISLDNRTAKELKVFRLENYLLKRFSKVYDEYFNVFKKIKIRRTLFSALFNIISTISYYFTYVYVIYQTVMGNISIGTLTMMAGAFQQMHSIFLTSANRFSNASIMILHLSDFFQFLDLNVQEKKIENEGSELAKLKNKIEFVDVSFSYPGSEKYVIKNLNLTINAGESLAFVGENGAGKTTLVKLIAGLYEPIEGKIYWDGEDISKYSFQDYRKKVSVIFQDFNRYMFTAYENIAVGDIEEKDDKDRVLSSAEKGLALPIINKLENGFDQMLGRHFKNGVELSGGQWQKIAISRGFMKDSEILILDEPSSALDAKAEYELFERFVELVKGKTAILISHRFSTVRIANRIIVLDNGQIIEDGSHEELISKRGAYHELFSLQAKGYS